MRTTWRFGGFGTVTDERSMTIRFQSQMTSPNHSDARSASDLPCSPALAVVRKKKLLEKEMMKKNKSTGRIHLK
jgi:hypothetical protein